MTIANEDLKLVDEARERLLRQHGGYNGLWDFLLRQDRSRQRREKPSKGRPSAKSRRRKSPVRSS